ncbi:ATP-binding protein [Sporohalobacter salinus]|uniref:ATP-binding protein n=1 Tax=Sporohalobacter salinus TaxID=1494606 RepID=UPI00195F5689|nr:4Fe-4S binding protein [Sporohalobacter salinus]MBM7624139.1 ferredoxin [Sporohalobacter salinus]
MKKRSIIQIDEDKCIGCGNCVVDCEEGALEIVDGKAKLVNEVFCDGLGNCIGNCPTGALTIEKREAKKFDPEATKKQVKKMKKEKKETSCGCPGKKMKMIDKKVDKNENNEVTVESQLQNWPIQIALLPYEAPYFDNADLLITADCVPGAYGDYHNKLLKGKTVAMGCPKLDNASNYIDKLAAIIENNNLNSITIARMEVPCCSGLVRILEEAINKAESNLNIEVITIGIDGRIKE